jgi:hypothetical protein
MRRTNGVRTFIRMEVLFLLGLGGVACGASAAVPAGSSASASPMITSSTSATASTPDPMAGWLTFSSAAGKLSFRYDPTWKPTECAASDSPLIVLGHNVCGQVEPSFGIDSTPSAQAPAVADLGCDPSQPRPTPSSTTADGVTGTKISIDYTASAYKNCRLPIVHAVVYSFYTRGRAYTVTYLYIPSEGADQTSKVDRMVQSLRFSAT